MNLRLLFLIIPLFHFSCEDEGEDPIQNDFRENLTGIYSGTYQIDAFFSLDDSLSTLGFTDQFDSGNLSVQVKLSTDSSSNVVLQESGFPTPIYEATVVKHVGDRYFFNIPLQEMILYDRFAEIQGKNTVQIENEDFHGFIDLNSGQMDYTVIGRIPIIQSNGLGTVFVVPYEARFKLTRRVEG